MFIFCSYWRAWSRVLSTDHPSGSYVEVNLTPVNSWEKEVKGIRIRCHGTQRSSRDILTYTLPPSVRKQMVKNLGEDLTSRLLSEDFLPQIDWGLYKKHNNGGANLSDIKKNPLTT